jgi:hypothetical protein
MWKYSATLRACVLLIDRFPLTTSETTRSIRRRNQIALADVAILHEHTKGFERSSVAKRILRRFELAHERRGIGGALCA